MFPPTMVPESAPPECPACHGALTKRPKAKTKCRHCGGFIYVRSGPDGGRWLIAEAELPAWAAEWTRASQAREATRQLWTEVHVVGESHRNPDGTSRQQLIRTRARVGELVQLLPEPDNEHDENAVKVCLATGEQIGYLERGQAEDMADERRTGWRHAAIIHRVLGGTPDKPSVGVLLRLLSAPPGTTETDVLAAMESARTEPDEWQRERARQAGRTPMPPSREPRVAITFELSAPRGPSGPEESASPRRARWPWAIIAAAIASGVLYLFLR
jgi:hypothetical protein